MRFPASIDSNGMTTLVVVDAFGTGNHGFSDGSSVLHVESMGANGDATEVPAQWFNDVTLAIKNACREGNGEGGPAANDVNDDPFELTRAVNTAANVLTGTASFVASGLGFTTSTASLSVTLSAGAIVYEGRKYHVTAAKLNAIEVEVNGAAAGTGNAFALIASRDHYISIGPLADDDAGVLEDMASRFRITVTDVANGAGPPSVPAGEFFFAMLATDGTGVTSSTSRNRGPVLDSGNEVRVRVTNPLPAATSEASLQPMSSSVDLGALSSGDIPESSGGHLFRTAYVQNVHVRGHSGGAGDRWWTTTRRTITTGAATNTMAVIDLDDFPNASFVEIEATVIGYADNDDCYVRTIRQAARRTSAGVMALFGSVRDVGGGAVDPGLISDSDAIFIDSTEGDGSLIQIRVTGTAGRTVEWMASIHTTEKRGAF